MSAVKLSPSSFVDSFYYTEGNVSNYLQTIKMELVNGSTTPILKVSEELQPNYCTEAAAGNQNYY